MHKYLQQITAKLVSLEGALRVSTLPLSSDDRQIIHQQILRIQSIIRAITATIDQCVAARFEELHPNG